MRVASRKKPTNFSLSTLRLVMAVCIAACVVTPALTTAAPSINLTAQESLDKSRRFAAKRVSASDASEEIVSWIEKMSQAASSVSFIGDFVYYQEAKLETYRLYYDVSSKQNRERLEALNGPERYIVKVDGELVGNFFSASLVGVNQRIFSPVAIFSNSDFEQLTATYDISLRKRGRIASRRAVNLVIQPRHKDRYGYRLSLDEQTGLLLRLLVIDADDKVIEQLQFVDVVYTDDFGDELFIPSRQRRGRGLANSSEDNSAADAELQQVDSNAYAVSTQTPVSVSEQVASAPTPVSASASDIPKTEPPVLRWEISAMPLGFKLRHYEVMQLSSGLVEHLLYSDGLASISLYIEPVDSSQQPYQGHSAVGVINTIGFAIAEHQFTMIGEIPLPVLIELARSVKPLGADR